eukprot:CAMPEP_0197234632 /NCGR_PEP_ID=MMETSP1429-20130617/2332_1 /TAXON_ID=49237 /ORGANISM="Chaetoceros  sp., Strain UNC1202" /LENGTH=501 /DNA_ID=CAMNT_0042693087 /DNA_START=82 /DNA_END=1587 /DNA_ORIENTATION=-
MVNEVVAVGCTSTLVSHGREDRSSRVHIALIKGDGRGVLCNVRLSATGGAGQECDGRDGTISSHATHGDGSSSLDGNDSSMSNIRRSRLEEEQLLAKLILSSIDQNPFQAAHQSESDPAANKLDYTDILNQKGDTMEIVTFHTVNDGDNSANNNRKSHNNEGSVVLAAQKVIDDNETSMDATTIAPQTGSIMVPIAHTVLPADPIVFPGSFNPPHVGHVSLAQAAVKTMTRKKKAELEEYFQRTNTMTGNSSNNDSDGDDDEFGNDSGDSNVMMIEDMWNTTEYQSFKSLDETNVDQGPFSVLFEMSLTNADKPSMEAAEAARRVELFGQISNNGGDDDDDDDVNMPNDWGVLLTSAPLFIDKVRLLKKYLTPSGSTHRKKKLKKYGKTDGSERVREITFVIGTDTMVRIINPKYYGDSYENMLEAVREMGDEGAHFVVGGRLEEIKGSVGGSDGDESRFVTGEDELEGLPQDVRNMFTIIKEDDFRVDISSSELRARRSS